MKDSNQTKTEGPLESRRTRRGFLHGGLRMASGMAFATLLPSLRSQAETRPALPRDTRDLLEASGLVYVSPLHADGSESRCHGEVWFGWLDETVVLITGSEAWKARALTKGNDRARIWVGDHGRWKGWLWNNEEFRSAPSLDARAIRSDDPALLERLMALYAKKYPAEFGGWEERMRTGFASGERVLIRYAPIS